MSKTRELISSITRKGTTMTAKALVNVKLKLEGEIATLLKKEKLSDEQKKQLASKKKQLRDVKAELAEEADKSGRSLAQGARDAKMKDKITIPKAPFDIPEKRKGGVMKKAMPFNKGGMSSHKGNFDMRKGGMFAK
mgnify:CR=1 FL=1